MQYWQDTFTAHWDNQPRFCQGWLPETSATAVIILVHGLAEHSGRYQNLVEHFVPQGYAIYGLDHLGHGRSPGRRCYAEAMKDFVEPLQQFIGLIKSRHPDLPVIVVGHSMGGLIAAHYLAHYQEQVDCAVLSAPAVMGSQPPTAVQKRLLKIASRFFPTLGLRSLGAEGVSRDPRVVADYQADPLVYSGKVTAGLLKVLGQGMAMLPTLAPNITLPVLVMQGEADSLVSPKGAKALYEWLGSTAKTLQTYPNCYHEIFNEPEHETVLTDMSQWLTACFPGS